MRTLVLATIFVLPIASLGIVHAAEIPFLEDYQSTLVGEAPQGFNAYNTTGSAVVQFTQGVVEREPGDFRYNLRINKGGSTTAPTMHSNIGLTNVADAIASGGLSISSDFTLDTELNTYSIDPETEIERGASAFFGLRFLAESNNSNFNSYHVDIGGLQNQPNNIRIVRYPAAGAASTGDVTVTDNGSVDFLSLGNTYHMVVNLSYNINGDLSIAAQVTGTDGFDKTAVLNTPIESPLMGEYFGTRLTFATGRQSGPVSVDVNNFNVSILPQVSGDFNGDNVVDGTDFLIWQRGFGGEFDAGDLADWKANFGSGGSQAAIAASIPEPNSAVLAAVTGLVLVSCRKRIA